MKGAHLKAPDRMAGRMIPNPPPSATHDGGAPHRASQPGSDRRPTTPVTLQFQIGRLTLPGMSRADTARVVDAMQAGLAKLARQFPGRDWRKLSALPRLDGGTLRVGARPEQIGEHLATQIFRRLSS
ncbi:MAG: hypothetical protein ABSE59_03355 [Opitutaceae bacterium]|jgi:hypothetical protein